MNKVQVREGELCFLLKTLEVNEPAEQLKLGRIRYLFLQASLG